MLDKVFVDEVTPYDIQMLLGKLKSENKKEATLSTYRGILKKFFAWITENGLVRMDNPVNKHSLIKQTSILVRDRLPKPEEIQRILACESQIMPVVRFLIHTGQGLVRFFIWNGRILRMVSGTFALNRIVPLNLVWVGLLSATNLDQFL